jgi:hypothetical protein
MTLFIQTNATGAGAGNVDPQQAFVDLALISNLDTALGIVAVPPNLQQVTYTQATTGPPPTRLNALVNTNFNVNPQNIDIIIIPALANFTLNDGTAITVVGGTALPPSGSTQPGAGLNNTTSCLVIYDTTQSNGTGYCTATAGTNTLNLATPNNIILFHELSHAFRIVTTGLLALTAACNPSSPEEAAAITDENTLRTQRAAAAGIPAVLRNTGNHCGQSCGGNVSCCIIATVASGSRMSEEVSSLRSIRDGYLRRTDVGYEFFRCLHDAYYGFSPEVVRLMAKWPSLQPFVLQNYVQPLVIILEVIESYTLGGLRGQSLLTRFRERQAAMGTGQPADGNAELALRLLEGDFKEIEDRLESPERELRETLLQRAVPNEYVGWGLIRPVRLYYETVTAGSGGLTPKEEGELLEARIDGWCSDMPLSEVWQTFTPMEARRELAFLKASVLVSAASRRKFVERFEIAFPNLTVLRQVVASELQSQGGHG